MSDWKIDRVEKYYYRSGRNNLTYVETTFWYNSKLERKETTRKHYCTYSERWDMPEWARVITNQNRDLAYDA